MFMPKCEYFEPFLNLTDEELYGISGNYKRGCECQVYIRTGYVSRQINKLKC